VAIFDKIFETIIDKLLEHIGVSNIERVIDPVGDYVGGHPVLLAALVTVSLIVGLSMATHKAIRKFRR
jgi:hypothetical protein